jgi:hypothetical protein
MLVRVLKLIRSIDGIVTGPGAPTTAHSDSGRGLRRLGALTVNACRAYERSISTPAMTNPRAHGTKIALPMAGPTMVVHGPPRSTDTSLLALNSMSISDTSPLDCGNITAVLAVFAGLMSGRAVQTPIHLEN